MSIRELLTLVVAIPLFLFLSSFYSPFCVLFFVVWVCCLTFDVYSTYQFYRKEPDKFGVNELNKIFSYLVEKFGFKKAIALFPAMIEIPLLLLFAMLPLPLLHNYLFPTTPSSLMVCLAAGFGIAAIGHLQAAIKNTRYNNKTIIPSFSKTTKQSPNT